MLFLTIINALPLKKRMKNAFLDNHIFTEYNLSIDLFMFLTYVKFSNVKTRNTQRNMKKRIMFF